MKGYKSCLFQVDRENLLLCSYDQESNITSTSHYFMTVLLDLLLEKFLVTNYLLIVIKSTLIWLQGTVVF